MLRVLDLFSGIGGFSLAAHWMGWKTIAFCEQDKFCQRVLAKNFPGVPIHEDVKKIEEFDQYVGTIDLVTGGYPCQPFSVAGKRRGKKDDRHLWPEMLGIIKRVRPTWVVAENVAQHVNLGLDDVLSDLEAQGYTARTFIIPAVGVNACHRRNRVWIVANANKCGTQIQSKGENSSGQVQTSICQKRIITNSQSDTQGGLSSRAPAQQSRSIEYNQTTPNAHSQRCQERNTTRFLEQFQTRQESEFDGDSESPTEHGQTEPGICRTNDGLSRQVDRNRLDWPTASPTVPMELKIKNYGNRLKSLGNSIVPQIAYQIFKAIEESHYA